MSRKSQRDRLLGRSRPSLPYPLLVDPDGAARARERLERAQVVARQARLTGRDQDAAEAELVAAGEELAGCYETIVLRALPMRGEVTVEKLIAAHPPTQKQMAQAKTDRDEAQQRGEKPPDWPSWDDDTYRPALLAATAESDMTADDWTDMLAERMSTGEVAGLWAACLAINSSARATDAVVLPKGWIRTSN
ncbi:hypothetical protein AB0C02_28150 [Micromonospora sp. NPDC048999]|uniref:hypothetical protein n=1 Tax=Micromonospora sp. NPDC048999 TaxID=3155391 RepID=UPI0033CBCA2A